MSTECITNAEKTEIESALSFLEQGHQKTVALARSLITYERAGDSYQGVGGWNWVNCMQLAGVLRAIAGNLDSAEREIFDQVRELWSQLPQEELVRIENEKWLSVTT